MGDFVTFELAKKLKEKGFDCKYPFATIVYEDDRKDSVMTYKTFDYRDLIPMELAIDATGLNIYKLYGK